MPVIVTGDTVLIPAGSLVAYIKARSGNLPGKPPKFGNR